jgi:hypothetical protein
LERTETYEYSNSQYVSILAISFAISLPMTTICTKFVA